MFGEIIEFSNAEFVYCTFTYGAHSLLIQSIELTSTTLDGPLPHISTIDQSNPLPSTKWQMEIYQGSTLMTQQHEMRTDICWQ